MNSQRDEVKRVIAKYENDIASLEEREEDLKRRIQIFENLIPTVLVWYMWKLSQADQPTLFPQSDVQEDTQGKLMHLESILGELQYADQTLKQEENLMRKRIEELETSLIDGSYQQYLQQIETPLSEAKPESENEIFTKDKKIKLLEKKQEQFKDELEDSETDWKKTCEELSNEISQLKEKLQKTNEKLKDSEKHTTQLEQEYAKKEAEVQEKIRDLEKQTEALYSEVIDKEQEREAEEENEAKEIKKAIDEVKSMKESITKSISRPKVDIEGETDDSELKTDLIPTIPEEEEEEKEAEVEVDLIHEKQPIRKSTDSKIKSLVILPEDVIIPGSREKSPRTSIQAPQIFEQIDSESEKPFHVEKPRESIKSKDEVAEEDLGSEILPNVSSSTPKGSITKSEEVLKLKPDEIKKSSATKSSVSLSVSETKSVSYEQPEVTSVDHPTTIEKAESLSTEVVPTTALSEALSNEVDITPDVSKLTSTEMSKEADTVPDVSKNSSIETFKGADTAPDVSKLPSTKTSKERDTPHTETSPSTRSEVSSTVSKKSSNAPSVPINDLLQDLKVPSVEPTNSKEETQPTSKSPSVETVLPNITTPLPLEVSPKPTVLSRISREAADVTEAHAITSEPLEISPADDSIRPTPSGLELQQEPGMLKRRPSIDSLAVKTLQSKCRIKDHLIKTMADQLRDLARQNVWSGNTLLDSVSTDPVKTYDFDRATLFQYLQGEEPKNFLSEMKSNESYSTLNPLNVRVLRKLDKDSLLIEWGPPPSDEVVGFQIFIDGEFMYWVHSAKRNKALLHPLDLSSQLDITVSPVNENGDIVYRSTVQYTPEKK